ncbi:DUF3325 family protein [Azospirillum doebereinerae]|nr:DUF3325 family protein [Azospirillum doebereinerae]MCG5240901.1 DUF3325 domain-containing protein [Azospirillum doebereinerae]
MDDGLSLLVVFALAYFAAAGLALAMDRHWRDPADRRAKPLRRAVSRLRLSGSVCAVVTLAVAVRRGELALGVLPWIAALTVVAFAVGGGIAAGAAGCKAALSRMPRP